MQASLLVTIVMCAQVVAQQTPPESLATIRLLNPTEWRGPVTVEVPVGRLAAPGVVDWSRLQLLHGNHVLPFTIREGRAHWQASLATSDSPPRAEDILVFACEVPPGEWVHVELVPGAAAERSAAQREGGHITIEYSGLRAVIDEQSGSLRTWDAGGSPLLAAPFAITPYRLAEDGYEMKGPFACGYATASIELRKLASVSQRATCVALKSNAAMTEVSFVLEPDTGPGLGLTYRMHSSGMLEIIVDERPWTGRSPWLAHTVEYSLPLLGIARHFPYLENRWAFYGFREYTASVTSRACEYRSERATVLELGRESINGRQYVRRLFPVTGDDAAQIDELVELADEGLIVDVLPVRRWPMHEPVQIVDDAHAPAVAGELEKVLRQAGIVVASDAGANPTVMRLVLASDPVIRGIIGDGFVLREDTSGYVLEAGTRLGLFSAVRALATHLNRRAPDAEFPLVARNPVVDLRGGGFGGGDFEVDFPFADDAEWRRVLDNLLDSGMNVFACLGMWSNWKMPVSYRYMPELRTEEPDAYDESSGAKFAELEQHREHGLKLARYLQDRGGQVWLWIPIGCVPTTYAKRYPDAMAPGSDKIPCFTHAEYRRYVDAFFRELLETYPLDGLFLVRDDNGGICTCDRCRAYVAQSRTKSPVWEQYLVIYDWLRTHGFRGNIAVYPYNDHYEPKLDPLLPEDFYIVGHGSGAAVLSRQYAYVGPMGDTWIDNLYANFRLAPTPRMKRLLADRGSFWIGGAYVGSELPWESIGHFGWEPTATPNSLRFDWAMREFGRAGAEPFVTMNDAYEELWDISALHMPPADWMKKSPESRVRVVEEGVATVGLFRTRTDALRKAVDASRYSRWFGHIDLYAPFFEYHLHRLNLFAKIYDEVIAHRSTLESGEGLPRNVRDNVLTQYAELYAWAVPYDAQMQKAPHGMLDRVRWMTKPYHEWMAGYDQWLDGQLEVKQFAGTLEAEIDPVRPGEPFTLRIVLNNQGVCPWVPGSGQRIELRGDVEQLGLPAVWAYEGDPLAPGNRRTIELRGTAPAAQSTAKLSIVLYAPYRVPETIAQTDVSITWSTEDHSANPNE
ncbi:MAG: hypothetical protein FJ276_17330 [Planctomycetes bacterium]|nr:hypothetical protein [Planctomycetota bacterium]